MQTPAPHVPQLPHSSPQALGSVVVVVDDGTVVLGIEVVVVVVVVVGAHPPSVHASQQLVEDPAHAAPPRAVHAVAPRLIAHFVRPWAPVRQQVTRPGELLGDIAYMSPERTRGTSDVDGRSDLYGLGATLYALLTGRSPFGGGSLPEVVTQIRTAQPEPPKRFQMSIPDMFQGTVLKLLAKRPEERFQTATELLADLERVGRLSGASV